MGKAEKTVAGILHETHERQIEALIVRIAPRIDRAGTRGFCGPFAPVVPIAVDAVDVFAGFGSPPVDPTGPSLPLSLAALGPSRDTDEAKARVAMGYERSLGGTP